MLGAGNRNPAGTVTAHPVRLRQAREGQAQHVVTGEGGQVNGFGAVVNNFLVDFVGEHHQLMFAGHIHYLLQDMARVHGTCRVIRVNNHDPLGA